MQRVALVGSPGSGKSTLARQLGPLLDLPVIHLDRHFWAPGWVMAHEDRDAWRRRQLDLLGGERWLVDGNYSSTLDLRLSLADTVIFLDFPKRVCLTRVLRRQMTRQPRPDLPEGCPERFDPAFLLYVMSFRPNRVLDAIKEHGARASLIRLIAPADVRTLLDSARELKSDDT